MGPTFLNPVTDTLENAYDEMTPRGSVFFLLSQGANPTNSIIDLCHKKDLLAPAVISLGEG
jgi:hypothetical protein